MKKWMAAALLAVAPLAAQGDALPETDDGLGSRLTQVYIAPAMAEFQQAAAHMGDTLQSACSTAHESGSTESAAAFERLVKAWAGIEFLRFGPLVDLNRFENIYFWPDPRGVMTRQVQGMLAKPVAEIPDARGLASHSIALKGLPALEYVLYRNKGLLTGAEADNRDTACAYALAVAGNLEQIGADLAAQWSQGGEQAGLFARPNADNPLYRSSQEVAAEVVKALSTGLQFQADVKLAPALGTDVAKANVRKAPFWRSGLAATSIEAAVQGMLAFYDAGQYRFANAAWLDQNIRGELKRAADHLAQMHGSTDELFGAEDSHRELVLVTLLLRNAKDLVDQHMAPALGVRIGFNALDGD
ncbi:imelysin family protein [Pusillimonas sp.]|uniref:imelysin family protein n=1 Tax=Pusillimonas sp. TaxID=3040095 RepID=UPI0037C7AFAC